MFKKFAVLLLLLPLVTFGQFTLKGKFSPVEEFDWILIYKVTPTHSTYVGDTKINTEGKFEFALDSTQTKGMYRLVYAVPQEEFNFDIIYNAKEDIEFTFDIDSGLEYQASNENKLITSYTESMAVISQSIGDYYNERSTDSTALMNIFKTQREIQNEYEKISKGTIAGEFIRANKPYIPEGYLGINDYIKNIRKHFFDHVNFNSEILQSSNFLVERILNFVFGMVAQGENDIESFKTNISAVAKAMKNATPQTKKMLLHILWQQFSEANYEEVANFITDNYLLPIARTLKDTELSTELIRYRSLSFGKIAPDFDIEILEDNKIIKKKLSALDLADKYVLVFWSSSCSHCLEELPLLRDFTKKFEKGVLKVVAFGIEDDEYRWKSETYNYPEFIHVIGLGKWENEISKIYNISSTPTYFVLDKSKRIIAKPLDIVELKSFFKDQK